MCQNNAQRTSKSKRYVTEVLGVRYKQRGWPLSRLQFEDVRDKRICLLAVFEDGNVETHFDAKKDETIRSDMYNRTTTLLGCLLLLVALFAVKPYIPSSQVVWDQNYAANRYADNYRRCLNVNGCH